MCGVPIERADDYLNRLIALGHRVAVCEQLEDPAEAKKRGAKSVVRRDVVRLVTPGTITEERLLEPGRARLLVAVQRVRAQRGTLDLWSRGARPLDRRIVPQRDRRDRPRRRDRAARAERDRRAADGCGRARLRPHRRRHARRPSTPLAREAGDGSAAERRVCEFYGVETLDGFGAFTRAEIAAAALALAYVRRTQFEARPALSPPTRRARGATLEIDPATRANLELTRTLAGARDGSLLATIDLSDDPGRGAAVRRAAGEPARPIPGRSTRGSMALDFLVEARDLRESLRRALASAPDFLRSLSRLSLDRGGPRDLASVRDGLAAAAAVARLLRVAGSLPAGLERNFAALGLDCGALERDLSSALADDLPLVKRDGGFVRAGALVSLDEARSLRDAEPSRHRRHAGGLRRGDRRPAAQDQAQQFPRLLHRDAAGAGRGAAQGRRSTRASSIARRWPARCASPPATLVDLEAKIASAADRALALELDAFERLRQACLAQGAVAARLRRGFGGHRRGGGARRTRGEARLDAPAGRRLARLRDRARAPSGGRGGAQGRRRAVRRQRLRSFRRRRRRRAHRGRHRPEHGGQVDLSAPERADRADRPDGLLCAGGARPCRSRRPAVLAGRRGRRPRARPFDLHGRDGRDGRDPQSGDRSLAGDPRRDRAGHGDLRRPVDRLCLRRASQCDQIARAPCSPPISTS